MESFIAFWLAMIFGDRFSKGLEISKDKEWDIQGLSIGDLVADHDPRFMIQAFIDNLTKNAVYVRKERIAMKYARLCKQLPE